MLDEGETIGYLKKMANILRDKMMQHQNWVFDGNFENFENPPLLQFFLTHLLFGCHVHKVSGMRNDDVDKTVDAACQSLTQNTRSDRQVKHQSKMNEAFHQTVQTPITVGIISSECVLNREEQLFITCITNECGSRDIFCSKGVLSMAQAPSMVIFFTSRGIAYIL